MNTNDTEKLRRLLEGFATATLTTRRSDGGWHARPMAVAQVEDNADVWFITSESTVKAAEIEADSHVLVVCQEGWKSCVVVEGCAALVRDREKVRELWKPAFRPWFTGGVDDESIILIRVAGNRAEFWDNTGTNRLIYAYESLKAVMKGSAPAMKGRGQHGQVALTTSKP